MLYQCVVVFVLSVVFDWIWGRCVKRVADKQPLAASVYASALTVTAAVMTISYVSNHWLVIPAAIGAFVGTYLTVKY